MLAKLRLSANRNTTPTSRPGSLAPKRNILLVIATVSIHFTNAIGQTTIFADPGLHAANCTSEMIRSLAKTVETQDPTLLYFHVPFDDDKNCTCDAAECSPPQHLH